MGLMHCFAALASLVTQTGFDLMPVFGTLVLAGIAMVLRVETPVVWTFLYSIAGLAALTNNLGTNLK
jgi:hypothetical protein